MSENKVPFTTKDTPQELVERMHDQMEKPFTTIDTPPKKKLYLILSYIKDSQQDNKEPDKTFEFFIGTTQKLYDHLKDMIISHNRSYDIMKSRVLVDAPNIRISHKCSVFMFMKDTKDLKKIEDNSGFDISEYWYNLEETEGDDILG